MLEPGVGLHVVPVSLILPGFGSIVLFHVNEVAALRCTRIFNALLVVVYVVLPLHGLLFIATSIT